MKDTLKKLRIENRYSQELLAKILGVSRLSYMKYESGEVEPPIEIVRKLSKIYKVSYKTLIDNELSTENKPFSYEYGKHKEYEVASSSPAYGDIYSSNSSNVFAQFTLMLSELQRRLFEMQTQINMLQNSSDGSISSNKEKVFNKSKSFNKEQFFAEIGKIQMDSSYINELREASLI